jgi:hypothetical protein
MHPIMLNVKAQEATIKISLEHLDSIKDNNESLKSDLETLKNEILVLKRFQENSSKKKYLKKKMVK